MVPAVAVFLIIAVRTSLFLSHKSFVLFSFIIQIPLKHLKNLKSDISSQVWLVTGCSSGFRAAFTRAILARGDRVIAIARNITSLKSLKDAGAACLQLDISISPEELHSKAKQAEAIYGGVDILVNNAGYAQLGAIEEIRYVGSIILINSIAFLTEI